jgi:predicted nucleic acid-binding protein
MRIWVVDTSPLIFLAKLNRLDLLKEAGQVLVPTAVLREIQEYPDEATAQIEEARRSWLQVQPVRDDGIVEVLTGDLDAGESEVLALAREVGRSAKSCAEW